MDTKNLNQYIDHTLLKPNVKKEQIIQLCNEAKEHGFAAVCVNPMYISLVKEQLEGTQVKVCTVVGFPFGMSTNNTKALETRNAVMLGAEEIDMVINISALKDGEDEYVAKEIKEVVDAAEGNTVKVIIETCYLTDEEKRFACRLAADAGAHFVKTSTGFGPSGATVEDVKLMKEEVGDKLGVKASGGIRDRETAIKMIEAGATRIGTSNGVEIV
ncbi:deoxyribose-phosphate aldolase [Desulfitispora alkaliphila]|uniref:deoxyribose-phosphate aldolase n=1 Tax=Desulfitispora alkaliphila TaxID=622674 RepID=UPI003D221AE1